MRTDTTSKSVAIARAGDGQLLERQRTFALLHSRSAHVLWLPSMIDVCLDEFSYARTLEEITSDPRFYIRCEVRSRGFGNSDFSWTEAIVNDALTDPACPFLEMFLRRYVAKVRRMVCRGAHHQDLITDVVRSEYFRLVEQYNVGALNEEGSVVTWGYEAFLATRLPGRSCARLHRRLRESTNCEEQISQIQAPLAQDDDQSGYVDVSAILKAAIVSVLSDDWQRDAFRRLVYRGDHGKTIAAQSSRRANDIHRYIMAPLVREMQKAVGACQRPRFYLGCKMRKSLAALLPEAEFAALFNSSAGLGQE